MIAITHIIVFKTIARTIKNVKRPVLKIKPITHNDGMKFLIRHNYCRYHGKYIKSGCEDSKMYAKQNLNLIL